MIDTRTLASVFETALSYEDYLATDPAKAARWREVDALVSLTPEQHELVSLFSRSMKVLAISGIWCGDCVDQGPLLRAIGAANPVIDLRWVDRDEHEPLARRLAINEGLRVPVVIFMAEDYEPGDRTLTRYRALAARHLGGACPLPGAPVPADERSATLQDWLDEFERVHLLLRLSGRLRQLHGD